MLISTLTARTKNRHRAARLSSILLLMATCASSYAEGGFVGVYSGTALSNSADKTSNSFKILTGAHITSELSLEFGYVNMGKTHYNDPKAINQEKTNSKSISFSNANHGSIALGQPGEATPQTDAPSTYENKSSSTFTGVSDFTPQGALINFSYKFPLVDNRLDFFLKTGFFAWEAKYKTIEITASQTGIDRVKNKERETSAVNTISGAGFLYSPIPELSFRAEIESTAISSGAMKRVRMQNLTIGANWEF